MTDTFRLPIAGNLENHYAQLPEDFYTRMPAEKVGEAPRLIHANSRAAALLDLDPAVFRDPRFVEVAAGHRPLEGFSPLAMVYSGHQFGVWAGQLGDGRALLIGQVRNRKGELWDIQLKRGVSVENVAAILGNTPLIVQKHYAPFVQARQLILEQQVRATWYNSPRFLHRR